MKKLQRIDVNGIRLFAYHGCMDEESRIGTDYEVNLSVWADLRHSAETDKLKDTVDYVALNRIVKEEMAIRAKLLEVVAKRIVNRILNEETLVQRAKVSVSKLAPPIQGDVERVSVVFKSSRT
jgi:7,8-dihydroneopterin aldolase/epimerase/oxygenase